MPRAASPDLFRARLKSVLARSGQTPAGLAKAVRIDRSTLSQLLDDAADRLPRAETLAAIASHCRVSVDWLLGLSNREEIGAEIIESVLQFEASRESPLDDRFAEWLKQAAGARVKTVPVTFPDFLKTDAVLRFEYMASQVVDSERQIRLAQSRLDVCRQPDVELEAAIPFQALDMFARGEGVWRGLALADRQAQLRHLRELYGELYPGFRMYMFDQRRTLSVPFSVFGQRRMAIYLGQSYLVLSSIEHIRLFSQRFDDLIRAAVVQPHEVSGFVERLEASANDGR